ncbi:molecular chaperone DnaJ [Candidatus Falkowbacteria bacterium]|jgi:molecular chaperone DnaJ|nr:molecular chaperone DnaJ [Candidatus Falkowbacteria bacterium]MBT7007046.1 molecular chaperone DnaJ [Candidatus Falkowbacteria bacterium]
MSKDYYKTLGIEKNANQDEIKRAFRKLAHKYHPDKPDGDEAKFKECNEAYQVLGNEQKRQQYDQFGSSFDQQGGFGGGMGWEDFMSQARQGGGGASFDFGDIGDIFGDVFGFGRNSRRQAKGADIQIDLQISFKDSVFGVDQTVELYKATKCSKCNGNGAEPGTPIEECKTCNGQGKIKKIQKTFLGAIQTATTCQDCHGEGKKAKTPCGKCAGTGISNEKERIEIKVPAGIEADSTLRMSGKGNAAPKGGIAGDLYVRIFVKQDSEFLRKGNDIVKFEKISFKQAALGDKLDVKTLDGEISLKVPAGTQPNTKFRLKGKGVPYLNSSGRGDLYIQVEVEVPTKLNKEQKKALESFS